MFFPTHTTPCTNHVKGNSALQFVHLTSKEEIEEDMSEKARGELKLSFEINYPRFSSLFSVFSPADRFPLESCGIRWEAVQKSQDGPV